MAEERKEQRLVPSGATELTIQNLRSLIYTIRDQQVMLDSDLATIYGYEVRALNQQVKRNLNRFPDDFMFQLTKEEVEAVKSQIVIHLMPLSSQGNLEVGENLRMPLQSKASICWVQF